MSLLKRVGLNPGYMMTGGVAKNPGVVAVLEEQLGEKLHKMCIRDSSTPSLFPIHILLYIL